MMNLKEIAKLNILFLTDRLLARKPYKVPEIAMRPTLTKGVTPEDIEKREYKINKQNIASLIESYIKNFLTEEDIDKYFTKDKEND